MVVLEKIIVQDYLTDFSKALGWLSHEVIVVKLNVFVVSLIAPKLICNTGQQRQHKTKINKAYSSWRKNTILYLRAQY